MTLLLLSLLLTKRSGGTTGKCSLWDDG